MKNAPLYKKLEDYDFDEGYVTDSGYSFIEKIAKSNNWTIEYSAKVIQEYKRFMYLLITFKSAAPSDAIDQVWHQHILYTKDYAAFCDKMANRFINHSPDRRKGSSQDSYVAVTSNYNTEFGTPPQDVWSLYPADFKRVNLMGNYLIPAGNIFSIIKLFFKTIF